MKRPKHIGFILDGNRRFAKSLNQDVWRGHEFGYKKVTELLKWCKEKKIEELTLYVFSIQNFNRPKKEFEYLMKLFEKAASESLKQKDNKGLKVQFIGRIHLLPENVQKSIVEMQKRTEKEEEYKLNIAIAYGGREEIEDAVNKIALEVKSGRLNPEDVNQDLIDEYVYIKSKPDLIIRTGGEKRTSNFLSWQSPYSEWIFLDKKWPEFTKQDFEICLEEYSKRDIRKGR